MIKVLYIRISKSLEDESFFSRLQGLVSRESYCEALTFGSKKAALDRLVGEALVTFALHEYWGMPRGTYRLSRQKGGKPFVENRKDVFFNISHSGEYVVSAVSNKEIGVDIEKRARAKMKVAKRFFHEQEIQCLNALSGVEQDQLFFNYWAVKESFLKYIGTGLVRPLNTFSVVFGGEHISLYEDTRKLLLHVKECVVDVDYACYVCSENDEIPEMIEVSWQRINK